MKKWSRFLAVAVVLTGVAACAQNPGSGSKSKTVTIKGSDTMVILGQRWAETYMQKIPGATVQVTGGGSGTGIAALINGVRTGCKHRFKRSELKSRIVTTPISHRQYDTELRIAAQHSRVSFARFFERIYFNHGTHAG